MASTLEGLGFSGRTTMASRAEYATRVGHALAEVAGGGDDYATLLLLGAELGHGVEGAANLERAEPGVIFVLDIGLGADDSVEAGVVVEWGGGHIVGEKGACLVDVLEGGASHRGDCLIEG